MLAPEAPNLILLFQDTLEELKLVIRGSLSQAASLQDCFLPQIEPAVQYPGNILYQTNFT